MAGRPDFAAEGLLEDLDGGARDARLALLELLHDGGVGLDELRGAVQERRLAILPVDRALAGDPRYTLAEAAAEADADPEVLRASRAALGIAVPEDDERAYTDEDVESLKRATRLLQLGIEPEALLELTRVLGELVARAADAVKSTIASSMLTPGVDERQLALRYANVADELMPEVGPLFAHVFRLHLRDALRSDAITAEEIAAGRLEGGTPIAVAFADLVGFTAAGESVEAEELGALANRLARRTAQVIEPPVRLVKTIGDAVMLVAPEPEPLVRAVLALADWEHDEDDAPRLKAGVACGTALARWGDFYGRPVNLASRVTSVARPGTVLVTKDVRDAVKDGFKWSSIKPRKLKGIEGAVPLYRARPVEAGDADGDRG